MSSACFGGDLCYDHTIKGVIVRALGDVPINGGRKSVSATELFLTLARAFLHSCEQ
jgi:hypothetical protein